MLSINWNYTKLYFDIIKQLYQQQYKFPLIQLQLSSSKASRYSSIGKRQQVLLP